MEANGILFVNEFFTCENAFRISFLSSTDKKQDNSSSSVAPYNGNQAAIDPVLHRDRIDDRSTLLFNEWDQSLQP